jgi:hypothetical protein
VIPYSELDAAALLQRVAEKIPRRLRSNVVVVGSIATAWAFREISGTSTVATKDIDLILRPAVDAVDTAESLGGELLSSGWVPQFPPGFGQGRQHTPDDGLPALRLAPPGEKDGWFIELLAEPPPDQVARRHWRRFTTPAGQFGLPSFRYMPVAVRMPEATPFGIRVARPANMALAHLLEHADPDRTPISSLAGTPPRFVKDVGRAVSLWWLAGQQQVSAPTTWHLAWSDALDALHPGKAAGLRSSALGALDALADYLLEAHRIAVTGVLAPHGTTLAAWRRAHADLGEFIEQDPAPARSR